MKTSWSHMWTDDSGAMWKRTYTKVTDDNGVLVESFTDEELLFDERAVSDNDLADSEFQRKYNGPPN